MALLNNYVISTAIILTNLLQIAFLGAGLFLIVNPFTRAFSDSTVRSLLGGAILICFSFSVHPLAIWNLNCKHPSYMFY